MPCATCCAQVELAVRALLRHLKQADKNQLFNDENHVLLQITFKKVRAHPWRVPCPGRVRVNAAAFEAGISCPWCCCACKFQAGVECGLVPRSCTTRASIVQDSF